MTIQRANIGIGSIETNAACIMEQLLRDLFIEFTCNRPLIRENIAILSICTSFGDAGIMACFQTPHSSVLLLLLLNPRTLPYFVETIYGHTEIVYQHSGAVPFLTEAVAGVRSWFHWHLPQHTPFRTEPPECFPDRTLRHAHRIGTSLIVLGKCM